MSEVAAIPESFDPQPNDRRPADQWPEPPRLLIEWSSRWEEFKSALRPALARPPKALAGEAPIGIFPYRGMIACWLLECLLVIAIIVLPERFASLQLPGPPVRLQWDVIYYSADELPQTQDRGGAEAGKSGLAGGQQAHHRTQTIRVARGDKPVEKVVDAPKINLPHSDSAVANLLAFKANPGPPPAEGLRSALTAPTLPEMKAVPPAPELNASARHTANALATNIVPPAPEVSHASTRTSPTLSTSVVNAIVIPPAPNVSQDKMRTADPLASTVIAPAPRDAQRDLASSRVPMAQTADVVAPPVSAPQRDVSSTSKLAISLFNGFLYADALSALVILLNASVALVCAVYAVGYLREDERTGALAGEEGSHGAAAKLRMYYSLTPLLVFSLLLVALANNLGVMWAAIELTTLASVFLVTFYGKVTSLEAAWKYAMIGGVGLSMALFGTVLTYYAGHKLPGSDGLAGLNWSNLVHHAAELDKTSMRMAFILVLLGYGTKAGLAPIADAQAALQQAGAGLVVIDHY